MAFISGECVLSELPLLDRILCSRSIDPNFFAPKWLDPLNQWGMGLNHLCYQGLTRSLCKEIYEIERVENYGTVSFYQLHAASIFWAATVFSSQGPVSPGLPRSPPVAKELYSVTDGHQTTHHVAAFCLVHMLVVREWWLISGWATFRWGDCIFNIWLIHLVLLIPFFAWKRIIWKESDLTMPRCNISFSTLHFI